MPVTVVFDGPRHGGTLFEGQKFFVAQRVPSRPSYLAKITANGGEIVPLEKQADIVIVDHMKKFDCPSGSHTFKYIDDSISKGELQDLDKYHCGAEVQSARQVGSSRPMKSSRTPFTARDDGILMRWVMQAERKGLATQGNPLYEQLATHYPHHTWQSWRDRWVKYVRHSPRPDLSNPDETAVDPSAPRSSPQPPVIKRGLSGTNDSSASAKRRTTHVVNIPPNTASSINSNNGPLVRPESNVVGTGASSENKVKHPKTKSKPFTSSDLENLRNAYYEIDSHSEDELMVMFAGFSNEATDHNAKEWYDFWLKVVKPLGPLPVSQDRRSEDIEVDNSAQGLSRDAETIVTSSEAVKEVVRSKNMKVAPVARSEWMTTERVIAGDLSRSDSQNSPQTLASRMPLRVQMQDFHNVLREWAAGQGKDIDFRYNINGRPVRLFYLYRAVHNVGGFDQVEELHLWPSIADKVGISPKDVLPLKELYKSKLVHFADARVSWAAESDLHSQEDEHEDTEDDTSPENWERLGRGQSNNHEELSSPYGRQHKRQKHDGSEGKGKEQYQEIPSTPEELSHSDSESIQRQINMELGEMSPTVETPGALAAEDEKSEQIAKRLFHSRPNFAPVVEPETQDFFQSHNETASKPFGFKSSTSKTTGTSASQHSEEIRSNEPDSMEVEAGNPAVDSSTQSQTDSQQEQTMRELEQYRDYWISLGCSEDVVTTALVATNFSTGDAGTVIEALNQGKPIPDNLQGVWTAEDDADLKSENKMSKQYRRLLAKHGEDGCQERIKILHDLFGEMEVEELL